MILTLNFDRLIETALHEAGIAPVVASSVQEVHSLRPLHSIPVLVVHLHGDYLEGTTMRNTLTELGHYPPKLRAFLRRVFDDYGVLAAGWSAKYDRALIQPILASRPRFTTYMVERDEHLNKKAEKLRIQRGGVHVHLTADDAFARLADAVATLADIRARHPLSAEVAVSIVKRHRTGQVVSADVHDALQSELTQLQEMPELDPSSDLAEPLEVLVERVREGASVPAAMIAAAAYWGDVTTDRWWLSRLDSFAFSEPNPLVATTVRQLPLVAGSLLFHAAGLGALAADRHDLVASLLLTRTAIGDSAEDPVAEVFAPHRAIPLTTPSTWLFDTLRPFFVRHLGLSARRYRDVWEMFEFLRLLSELRRDSATPGLLATIVDRSNALAALRDPGAEVGLPDHGANQKALASMVGLELDSARRDLARLLDLEARPPHLRVRATPGAERSWGAAVWRRVLREAAVAAWLKPLSELQSRRGGTEILRLLAQAVSDASDAAVREGASALQPASGSDGELTHIWLDTRERVGN